MKATIANLKKALKACAYAHGVEYKWWRDDEQITLNSEDVPVVSDVRMIVESFYGADEVPGLVETGWGCTTVYLFDDMNTKKDVDEQLLALALPNGVTI